MVPFFAIYHPIVTFGGVHATYAHWLFRIACVLPLLPRISWPVPDRGILTQFLIFVGILSLVAFWGDPTKEIRTSFSQPCASTCDAEESSFWGAFSRKAYVCAATN